MPSLSVGALQTFSLGDEVRRSCQTYVGSKIEYNVITDIGPVFVVELSDKVEFTVGQQVYVQLLPEKLNIYSS